MSGPLLVEPNRRYIAEVVVLLTSLGAKRSEFNDGRRACDILEVKHVHRKVFDLNSDVNAGNDTGALVEGGVRRLLERDQIQKSEDDDADLCLPQIFIDGVFAGRADELQGLEDDGLLGRILRRELCVKCFGPRSSDQFACGDCGSTFEEVLPGKMTIDECITMDQEDRVCILDEDCNSGSEERFERYAEKCLGKKKKAGPKTKAGSVLSKIRQMETLGKFEEKATVKGHGSVRGESEKVEVKKEKIVPTSSVQSRITAVDGEKADSKPLDTVAEEEEATKQVDCVVGDKVSHNGREGIVAWLGPNKTFVAMKWCDDGKKSDVIAASKLKFICKASEIDAAPAEPEKAIPKRVAAPPEPAKAKEPEPMTNASAEEPKPSLPAYVEKGAKVNNEDGAHWTHIKRGDPMPADAVVAGTTKNDGMVWVGRCHGEAGKINCDSNKMWNFWGNHCGAQTDAGILVVPKGVHQEWIQIKRGDAMPANACEAGSTPTDGVTFVGRFAGEAGKVNTDGQDGKMHNFWGHKTGSKTECEILVVGGGQAGTTAETETAETEAEKDFGEEPSAKAPETVRIRRRCRYGDGCYRKNPDHRKEFAHPNDPDWAAAPEDTSAPEAPPAATRRGSAQRSAAKAVAAPTASAAAAAGPTAASTAPKAHARPKAPETGPAASFVAKFAGVPDTVKGYMWKRSPHPFRLRSMDWRFVNVEDMQVAWYKNEDEAKSVQGLRRQATDLSKDSDGGAKGFINLRAQAVVINVEKGNETTFTLAPKSGTWVDGAIAKGNAGKTFTFDTSKSPHTRAQWCAVIDKQIQMAENANASKAAGYPMGGAASVK